MTRPVLVDIATAVNEAVGAVLAHLDDPTRQGGVFCFARPGCSETDFVQGSWMVREIVDMGKAPKYERFAREKAMRLDRHPDDLSSWGSRNEAEKQYGGAIRVANEYLFSFSGLPEHGDEAAMLFAGLRLEFIDRDYARRIASISSNQTFFKMIG